MYRLVKNRTDSAEIEFKKKKRNKKENFRNKLEIVHMLDEQLFLSHVKCKKKKLRLLVHSQQN